MTFIVSFLLFYLRYLTLKRTLAAGLERQWLTAARRPPACESFAKPSAKPPPKKTPSHSPSYLRCVIFL
jgi:hypothetical protein